MIKLKTKPLPKVKIQIPTGTIMVGTTEKSKDEVQCFLIRKPTMNEFVKNNKYNIF